jgi:putative phosphoribosyl transferase
MNTDTLTIGPSSLPCELALPPGATGLVLLAYTDRRDAPQERALATALRERGIGTLAVELLGEPERLRRANFYNVGLLAHRLFQAIDWTRRGECRGLNLGLFGTGTAAAAALVCAAERPQSVRAVVARSGRPELALESLDRVRAPTLLITGDRDRDVLQLNYDAYRQLRCDKRLEIVPGAGCGFDEPGAGQAAAGLLAEWFARHLDASEGARAVGSKADSGILIAQ